MSILWLLVSTLLLTAFALNNGAALTPPMGWGTRKRFDCITDCKKYPNECTSENLIKRTADLLVSDGYLAAGYNYVGIDDCWLEKQRGSDGRMVPDRERFPNGMKALSQYLHSRGFKFAMYQNYGNLTCAGYPGLLGHEQLDIDTFVDWEIDYLKVDGCSNDIDELEKGFLHFGKMLKDTRSSIVYACNWPSYFANRKRYVNYTSLAEHCNLWRNFLPIRDSWSSVAYIMNWFGNNQDRFASVAGPGHWNDPDTLVIGNYGLSVDQARVQMAVWAVMAAPLFISVDLATIRPEFKEILLNKDIIAVDQDPLGKQGLRVASKNRLEIWKRELADGSYAMAFVSRRVDGTPYAAIFTFEVMTLPKQDYDIQDLYKEEKNQTLQYDKDFEVRVNPTGVKFYKFTPKKTGRPGDNRTEATIVVNNTLNSS